MYYIIVTINQVYWKSLLKGCLESKYILMLCVGINTYKVLQLYRLIFSRKVTFRTTWYCITHMLLTPERASGHKTRLPDSWRVNVMKKKSYPIGGDLWKESARWPSLLWALDLGLVLYKWLPPTPPPGTPIIGSNTLGSCPWMALSSLKERQYSHSSK